MGQRAIAWAVFYAADQRILHHPCTYVFRIDRPKEGISMAYAMEIQATLAGEMRFDIETGSGHLITLDTVEQDAGPRPMELLLAALAGCAGMDIITILRKMRQEVTSYTIQVYGERAEQQPRPFTEITVEHVITGHAINPAAVQRAIDLTEQRYCGVSAMLDKAAKLTHTFRIAESPAQQQAAQSTE
jgi:putative redox protein